MSTGSWYFRKIQPGGTTQEPTQAQFFQQDSITETPGKAIVREGIQNALDERSEGDTPVRVRIMLESLPPGSEGPVLSDSKLQTHIDVRNNGLMLEELPAPGERFRFLVFEDFGTTGLTGSIESHVAEEGTPNNFYNFFRAVGGTEKDEGKRGKWGVGKHTFWMASRINTVFCLTIREEDPKILFMGKTILKSHTQGDSLLKEYQDGYYGTQQENCLCLPVTGEDARALSERFSLRRTTEPGLSVVVPWLHKNITQPDIFKSVVEDYFYPILAGDLTVSARRDGKEVEINASTVAGYAVGERLKKRISLAEKLISGGGDIRTVHPADLQKPKWESSMFDEEMLKSLGQDYLAANEIFLKVKMTVTPKEERPRESHFKVAFARIDDETKEPPVFIRAGITIPDVKARQKERGIVALVIVDSGPLAEFLGTAENPSHTLWQVELVKQKYKHAPKVLAFVQDSVSRIINILSSENKEKDETLLMDIFPLEEPSGNGGGNNNGTPNPPPPHPKKCVIQNTRGGFAVCRGDAEIPTHADLVVETAYLTRGNALTKYSHDDFVLGSDDFSIEYEELEEVEVTNNRISARIIDDNFFLRVTGFDPNRDVYVKADVQNTDGEED